MVRLTQDGLNVSAMPAARPVQPTELPYDPAETSTGVEGWGVVPTTSGMFVVLLDGEVDSEHATEAGARSRYDEMTLPSGGAEGEGEGEGEGEV